MTCRQTVDSRPLYMPMIPSLATVLRMTSMGPVYVLARSCNRILTSLRGEPNQGVDGALEGHDDDGLGRTGRAARQHRQALRHLARAERLEVAARSARTSACWRTSCPRSRLPRT